MKTSAIFAAMLCTQVGLCAAQVARFANTGTSFRWTPALTDQAGVPLLAETLLDITLTAAENASGLGQPLRGLSYGYYTPPTANQIFMDRVTRSFPTGLAGIATGEFIILESDAAYAVARYEEGEQVGPAENYITNAALAMHSTTGSQQMLGERITIGVRIPVGTTEDSFHYGYVTLEWRQNLAFSNLLGGTSTLNVYQPVEWAYEMTPDTPITVADGNEEPGCPADVNGDGQVTPADFGAWITAFNAQSPACDQNGDTLCTPADFGAWITNFNAGC